jgi:type I restriction enzyme S subunit
MGDFSTVPRRFESKTKLANRLLEVGDLVLETAGGSSANGQFTGRTLLVTEEILSSLGPTICASFCKRLALDSSSVEPEYFYWYMQDLYSSGRVAIYDSQSTGISNFQFANFLDAEILILPKPATQRVIAQSLSKLNELIVLNRQVTKSLEEIAQTIFRSWFIDFDPVKAKMAGEKPVGMDDATAALFPDSMVDSELGPIPLSWKLGTLEDACLILDSKRVPLSGAERKKRPGKIPYFGATGILDFVDSHLFEGPHVLVGEDGSVITKSGNPFVQYVWGKFWVSNHAHVLQGRGGFSVEQLKLFLDRIQISNYVTGAVQPKLNQGNLKSIPCLLPVVNVSEAFNLIIGPMFDEIRELSEQTKLLVEIRDRLLPRLISGELQIPEEMLGV